MADALNDVHLWSVLLGSRVVNHLKMCRLKFSIISIKPGTTCTSVVLDLKREMESSAGSFELKALSMEQCFEWLFFLISCILKVYSVICVWQRTVQNVFQQSSVRYRCNNVSTVNLQCN